MPVPRRDWLWRDILLPLLVSRLTLMLVGWMAMRMLHNVRPGTWEIGWHGNIVPIEDHVSACNHPLINMWSRWDAGWYQGIAESGYKFTPDRPSNVAFFPMYPMLMRAAHIFAGSHRHLWWFLSGIVVSNAALAIALTYLFLLVRLEFDEAAARRAVLYLLIFPTTLFLSAVYSESVFLAFTLSAVYYARKRAWWLAGFLSGAAALSRPPGVVIFVWLLVEYLLQCGFNWRRVRWNVVALGFAPLGLASYFAFLQYFNGTPTAAVRAQFTWGLRLEGQWRTIAPFFSDAVKVHGTVIDLAFTLVFFALVVAITFRLRASYVAYSVAYIIFITMWGSLESVPRYVLGLFPAIMLLALLGRDERFHRTYVPISAALAAFFMAVFAVWGWVA